MISRIGVIFSKELIDNLRDKRSVLSALLTPLFMPLMLVTLIMVMGKTVFQDPIETILNIPVAGAENAPGLIQYFKENGVSTHSAPVDPQNEVRNGNADLVLVIPKGYGDNFTTGKPAAIQLIADSSRQASIGSISRVRSLINQYSQQISAMRLLARGIDPNITSPLVVENFDVATPQSQALIFLNMLPFLLIMTIFVGGMYVVIDTIAGERERQSLEPLLINPVARREFVLGKVFASIPFAVVTLIIVLVAFSIAFNLVPLEQFVGFSISIDSASLWMIFWICLPMILFASGLQVVVATFTRSFKEAQTYLSFLPLVAGLPGMFLGFLSVKTTTILMMIPTFSQSLLINQVMRGENINPMHMLVSIIATLVVSLALVLLAIRLYEREQILFSK